MLIEREVLGFSAAEVAESLQTTVASVNSALQRARAAVAQRVPEQSQQATLRALGDEAVRAIVDRYVDAWERCDIDAFAAMLAGDATFAMPPLASWYAGREAIAAWAAGWPLSGAWRWRTVRTYRSSAANSSAVSEGTAASISASVLMNWKLARFPRPWQEWPRSFRLSNCRRRTLFDLDPEDLKWAT